MFFSLDFGNIFVYASYSFWLDAGSSGDGDYSLLSFPINSYVDLDSINIPPPFKTNFYFYLIDGRF